MKKKTKARLRKGREVITIDSLHSHILLGSIGVITEVLKEGYAVSYKKTVHIALFGGDKKWTSATVFMRDRDIQYAPANPVPAGSLPK